MNSLAAYFNPFSTQFDTTNNFKNLSRRQQAGTVALTVIATILTLPILGLGGLAACRYCTKKLCAVHKPNDTILDCAAKALKIDVVVKDITNKTALDEAENDGNPVMTDILESLEKMKKNTFKDATIKSKQLSVTQAPRKWEDVSQTKPPSELLSGEVYKEKGQAQCGDISINYAAVMRAVQPEEDSKKPIEDQLAFSPQQYSLSNGDAINTFLVVSNDGNQKNTMSLFYSNNAPKLFQTKLNAILKKENSSSIEQKQILQALKETHESITSLWMEHVKEKPNDVGSATTVNMVFLYPGENGAIQGGFFGSGDTRTLLINKEGKVSRIGNLKGESLGVFQAQPGSKLFISSDGIWHNASPQQVAQFIQERAEDYKEMPESECLENVLIDLVKASLHGREDDRNPMIISIPNALQPTAQE